MIDLTKLKALELPTKEIEVEILGEKQTVKIVCPGEDTSALVSSLYDIHGDGDPELSILVIKAFIKASLPDMSIEDIDLIVKRDFKAAATIAAAGRDLFTEFLETKKTIRGKIEKNLNAEALETGNHC